jgi:putative transposase
MYNWRQMTDKERDDLLGWRRQMRYPWHSPPHRLSDNPIYHLTAACYEHAPIIGATRDRIAGFSDALLAAISEHTAAVYAWCVLPSHYHLLLRCDNVLVLLKGLGQLHGRTSHAWNGQDDCRGRQVWCKAAERGMRSEGHRRATLNYIHNNPVHHGYARRWQDWPFSSAVEYLQGVGREEAERVWREYPVLDYGKGWDDPEL